MSVKIVTSFSHLMKLAHTLGQARLKGNEEEIKLAKQRHDEYANLCLQSDKMIIESLKSNL